ncbi:2294_t:CDS:2 [Acaulospora colombiana]|uniref:2294_t:CDS:1 n=1 Tax=Acaulospora colombiana TaxID=27376 RepID=A0ACA9KW18_9GLOM|nr:2294_t:CDS:2 [Acaulospora colombiana]
MTKHPSSVRLNAEKRDETLALSATSLQQTAAEKEAIKSERVKTEAKLEGRSPDTFAKTYNEREDKSTGSGLVISARKNENRLSKESGKGSSSLDERYIDEDMELCVSDSGNSISPRGSQLLDDLDDTMIKITNDRDKKYLGRIAEEDEVRPSNFKSGYIIHDAVKIQSRVNELRNSDFDSTSFVSSTTETEISTFNDTESSTSGGTNEPESPLNLSIPNSKEIQRRKNSFGRTTLGRNNSGRSNPGRSIFSVLSNSSLRSSTSISPKNSTRGSLSEPETEYPPTSPSKADKILGRTKLSSLSLRKNRSKSTTISDERSLLSLYLGYDPGLSSPESGEKPSKVGKILGLTAVEEKILLDKPPTGKIKRPRGTSGFQVVSNSGTGENGFELSGIPLSPDERSRIMKAGKILGWDEVNSKPRISGSTPVSSFNNSLVHKGYMAKYKNAKFLSKSWKRRYFILTENTLYCFKSHESLASPIDNFELTSETAVYVSDSFTGRDWVLEVNKGQKPWYLQADNVGDMKKWMIELKRVIKSCCKENSEELSGASVDPIKETIEDDSTISTKTRISPVQSIAETDLMDGVDVTIDQVSLPPPPRPSMVTSLPPPPRPRSAQNSSYPSSPQLYDVNEFIGPLELEPPLRPSSPVETLSPPRTRYGQNMLTLHYERPAHMRQQSGSISSVNTFMESRRSPPSSPESQRSNRPASSTIRQSIPIIMPSWISSPNSTPSLSSPVSTSLVPPPRSPPRPPPRIRSSIARSGQRTISPPPLRVASLVSDSRLSSIGPPPSIPLPLPPPRPITITPSHNRQPIPPPRVSQTHNDSLRDKTLRTQSVAPRVSLSPNSKVSLRPKSPPPRFSSVTYSPLPPPSRPPNLPLPPVPESPPVRKDGYIITNPKSKVTLMPPSESVEFPDDDDLDPDYADEVEASRRRSQKTEGSVSSSDTTFFSISDVSNDVGDDVTQLPASGLTFVMVEETLGDGELVLDLQYVQNGKGNNRFVNEKFEDDEPITNSDYGTIMPVDMT